MLTWMTAAKTWAHQESGPRLTMSRERHENRIVRGQDEREYNSPGNWVVGNDPEAEPNPEKLADFLNVPGTVKLVTFADEACPGFEPTYASAEGVYHLIYVVIAGFQSDSFFDGTATSDVTGPVAETLHAREGYANHYAEALDALTGAESTRRPLGAITLEEVIRVTEEDLDSGGGVVTDEILSQMWLEVVELQYTHSRNP